MTTGNGSDSADGSGETMRPLTRPEPPPDLIPALRVNGSEMTVARFEWLRDGAFIEGGPGNEHEAQELRINSAADHTLEPPMKCAGFGSVAPGIVIVRLYPDLDAHGTPAGEAELVDCSFPDPPDAEKCAWRQEVDGRTLTVLPEAFRPAALTLTAVYGIPFGEAPHHSPRSVVHATWAITRHRSASAEAPR